MNHSLPSRNQIHDLVNLHLGKKVLRAQVTGVHFTDGIATYDVNVIGDDEAQPIFGVSSKFISGDPKKHNERQLLVDVNLLCESSLSPEVLEKWEEVKGNLLKNRSLDA